MARTGIGRGRHPNSLKNLRCDTKGIPHKTRSQKLAAFCELVGVSTLWSEESDNEWRRAGLAADKAKLHEVLAKAEADGVTIPIGAFAEMAGWFDEANSFKNLMASKERAFGKNPAERRAAKEEREAEKAERAAHVLTPTLPADIMVRVADLESEPNTMRKAE